MSLPSVDVVCNKCGSVIHRMIMIKSVKDVLRPSNGRCSTCGAELNPKDFIVSVQRR